MGVVVGPILGFRGVADGTWRTSALVVTGGDGDAPELSWFAEDEDASNEEPMQAQRIHLKSFKARDVWRFDWGVEQKDSERRISYHVLGEDERYSYSVPANGRPPRIAYASCAGFSSLKELKAVKDKNAMWKTLAAQHQSRPFQLMISGGDQIYADLVWDVVRPLRSWLEERFDVFEDWEREEFTDEMRAATEDFYFDLYLQRWGQPEIAPVLSQVPSMMMWDDHDIFDGWGSHPQEQQGSPIFEGIFEQAREHFVLFQLQSNDAE